MNKREKGTVYENMAASYLEEKGYQILEKNFYSHFGEIDLIAKKEEVIIFVEVKYRKSTQKGYPQEAVTAQKCRRIIKSAQYYLCRCGMTECTCRFDVIAILGDKITHIENAFDSR